MTSVLTHPVLHLLSKYIWNFTDFQCYHFLTLSPWTEKDPVEAIYYGLHMRKRDTWHLERLREILQFPFFFFPSFLCSLRLQPIGHPMAVMVAVAGAYRHLKCWEEGTFLKYKKSCCPKKLRQIPLFFKISLSSHFLDSGMGALIRSAWHNKVTKALIYWKSSKKGPQGTRSREFLRVWISQIVLKIDMCDPDPNNYTRNFENWTLRQTTVEVPEWIVDGNTWTSSE